MSCVFTWTFLHSETSSSLFFINPCDLWPMVGDTFADTSTHTTFPNVNTPSLDWRTAASLELHGEANGGVHWLLSLGSLNFIVGWKLCVKFCGFSCFQISWMITWSHSTGQDHHEMCKTPFSPKNLSFVPTSAASSEPVWVYVRVMGITLKSEVRSGIEWEILSVNKVVSELQNWE